MDDDGSKAKKRVLPQWMTEDKVDTKKPFPTNVKRKKYRSPRKSTVYCMNEKELVDYALEIINKSKKEGGSEAETATQEDKVESCKDGDENPQTPSEGTRSPKLTPSPPKKLSNTNLPETLSDEEDDPLKYVREIFFS
ncbi:cell cycle regulator of non-homologous end joining isoform X1 [Rana temporaria]|uniref:cell cycle regulator of non-homologous end joining isoform X1 n=1 Tax=Rana temporaria TaxID=8407 RepID=UPI001AAD5032|nr:cell cycle regulator of non-homologous end joining isoform X1 [Rana temporaria]